MPKFTPRGGYILGGRVHQAPHNVTAYDSATALLFSINKATVGSFSWILELLLFVAAWLMGH